MWPEAHSFIVTLDGEVIADLGPAPIESLGWLADGRLVARVWNSGGNTMDLGIVDFDAGTLELLVVDFGQGIVEIDGLGERVAFATGECMSWGVP